MPEDTKHPAAKDAPKGPRPGSDKAHPMSMDDWLAARKAQRLDPAGTWVEQLTKDPKTNQPVKVAVRFPTPEPGSVYDCPIEFEEWDRAIVDGKAPRVAYVKFPHGSVQRMHAPPPGARAR